MAAVDRIYASNEQEYLEFVEWCKSQDVIFTDKYGKKAKLTNYIIRHSDTWVGGAIFIAPTYIDAYLIKHCPIKFVQNELMLNYGHWTQKNIDDAYDYVVNGKENSCGYYGWLKPEDFVIVDGIITIPSLDKSEYEMIKDGEIYTEPTIHCNEIGKHFRCIKHPEKYFNKPLFGKWYVTVDVPDVFYMWYNIEHNMWDYREEFVITSIRSSTATFSTIRAIKRNILKWKLPVNTIVNVRGRYIGDYYQFKITK